MGHTPPYFLKHGKNTIAYFANNIPNSLVIFVHGFIGHSTDTWESFPSLIKDGAEFENSDVIFYGYESLKYQANNNALKFYKFLKYVFENHPNKLGHKRDGLPDDFRFNKIVIVAHSLGAIIVRRALLYAKHENKEWINICKMILFAPAHKGTRLENLMRIHLPPLFNIILTIGMVKYPVFADLKPDSITLKQLLEDTEKYIVQNDGEFTKALKVIWAEEENIVYNENFGKDPIPDEIEGKDHIEICKPEKDNFIKPYEIVAKALIG